jgi:hypothetical protein
VRARLSGFEIQVLLGAAVWADKAVRVEREVRVRAVPEEVWAVARGPEGLSAMPGWFAFGVPTEVAGADRLCCLVSVHRTVTCSVVDVREQIDGQMICWQTLGTRPAGKQSFTIGVLPRPGGSTVRLSVSDVVRRPDVGAAETFWHARVRAWARSLREIAEGRAAWPGTGMPAVIQERCSAFGPLKKPAQASAAAVIHAPAAVVWEAVYAPEPAPDTEQVVYAGRVPGTPERMTGEMQYAVRRHPDGRLTAHVDVITAFADGVSAVTRNISRWPFEVSHLVTPVAEGTRLELVCRWPARMEKSAGKEFAPATAIRVRKVVEGYRALIEEQGSHEMAR